MYTKATSLGSTKTSWQRTYWGLRARETIRRVVVFACSRKEAHEPDWVLGSQQAFNWFYLQKLVIPGGNLDDATACRLNRMPSLVLGENIPFYSWFWELFQVSYNRFSVRLICRNQNKNTQDEPPPAHRPRPPTASVREVRHCLTACEMLYHVHLVLANDT